MLKKNDVLTVTVSDLTYNGLGFTKFEDFPIFIYNALPGEIVEIKILKVLKNYSFAKVEKFINKSEDRSEEYNSFYLQTGIAPLSHLKYSAQLKFKEHQFKESLHKFGIDPEIEPIISAPNSIRYRNKAQIPVRKNPEKILDIGFFRQNSHRFMPTEDFLLQESIIDRNLLMIRDILRKVKISAYDEQTKKGFVRDIMLRFGKHSKELCLVLVINAKQLPHMDEFVKLLKVNCPEITSFFININMENTNVIMGKTTELIYGKPYLTDTLLGNKYRISPESFYQVNPLQTENLYKLAIEYADLRPEDIIMDAYSGIGTIGNSVSDKVQKVIGVESVEDAVNDAKVNAELNDHNNITYKLGKAEEVIDEWLEKGIKVDKIFVDPPRKGLARNFIDASVKLSPKKIIYISCNPATLGRDLALYQESGYKIKKIRPVDMFPMTPHIESVTVLERN